ncbi:hypothetical protein EVAR_37590_1 [Eumeta japonica]|uniref:Uncharacterized protein n=1 Tax=Eumeta variegata TaxID=151549 RepID=A0A4C1VPU4_EUMVA|nr:hypothetical protein EVAR_37590_1 [Eumeta japonica]
MPIRADSEEALPYAPAGRRVPRPAVRRLFTYARTDTWHLRACPIARAVGSALNSDSTWFLSLNSLVLPLAGNAVATTPWGGFTLDVRDFLPRAVVEWLTIRLYPRLTSTQGLEKKAAGSALGTPLGLRVFMGRLLIDGPHDHLSLINFI